MSGGNKKDKEEEFARQISNGHELKKPETEFKGGNNRAFTKPSFCRQETERAKYFINNSSNDYNLGENIMKLHLKDVTSVLAAQDYLSYEGILDRISAMSYSVFQTANRCSWLLKKMHAEKILIDCQNTFQFINGLGKAIFCTEVGKAKQKLGLLRLILPQFLNKIDKLIKRASEIQEPYAFDVKRLLGDLVIK